MDYKTLVNDYERRVERLRETLEQVRDLKAPPPTEWREYPIQFYFPDYVAQRRLLNRSLDDTRRDLDIKDSVCTQLDMLYLLEKDMEKMFQHPSYQSKGYPEGYLCPESIVWRDRGKIREENKAIQNVRGRGRGRGRGSRVRGAGRARRRG